MHFFLSDQLGSTSTVLSATGAVEESQKYYPFGAVRSGSISLTDKQFTGQQEEPAMWGELFGLYNYGARFYSTTLGRFISPDPVGVSLGNPQSLNRYAYVLNNPLRYTDPTGYRARTAVGGMEGIGDIMKWINTVNGQSSSSGGGMSASRWSGPNGGSRRPGLAGWMDDLCTIGYCGDDAIQVMSRVAYFVGIYERGVAATEHWPDEQVRLDHLSNYLYTIADHSPAALGLYHTSPGEYPLLLAESGLSSRPVVIGEPNPCPCWVNPETESPSTAWAHGTRDLAMHINMYNPDSGHDLNMLEMALLPWSGDQRVVLEGPFFPIQFPIGGAADFRLLIYEVTEGPPKDWIAEKPVDWRWPRP